MYLCTATNCLQMLFSLIYIDSVMSKIGIKENAHVDLTKKEGTASTLLESKIVCEVHEKVKIIQLIFY